MTQPPAILRLALDQNFPLTLIRDLQRWLPSDVELVHLRDIDRRMSDLPDRALIIALHQSGWHGLITNNYKMLDVPTEVAAIVKTKLTVIAIEGLGQDPIRATGALLLELPGLAKRLRPRQANVFRLTQKRPTNAWDYFARAASKINRDPGDLWDEVGVTNEELTAVVLPTAQV